MQPLNIYFDTEFTQLPGRLGQWDADLISAGFVTDTGLSWYAERRDTDLHGCSAFVREHVLPQLDAPLASRLTRAEFGARLFDWLMDLDQPLQLICEWAGDWQLIEKHMADLLPDAPHPIKMQVWRPPDTQLVALACLQTLYWHNKPRKPHHALADAEWLRVRFKNFATQE